ncbi:dynein axonemal heavy chain 12-like isoform X1 [Osmia bicornis bicornis]|uniref:dynein axonemal heavy chain 12-like isoform X1 n=3 Tax=Osmia bicornis bicornis TaxID=1437191 RepID=UPI001EAF6C91|nr:dynein axonemal heavy chain 12-like isoform X1 [Osmia bicornis bicornis]XP_046144740.1 dynein axonemal heavy chain 12-like isoform X1 [Osmia bicornis bicornis]XP_046144741.1 dynein axonemal heavy chain 12-like isoform X1 [Osmia bicornis bicornis]XP_046144742.1 dynein axonemal heavy chain 12-like isoform X1 [Osmia bicornis bicornis]
MQNFCRSSFIWDKNMNVVNICNSSIGACKPENLIYNEMEICLENISFTKFPIEWEEHILNLLPKMYKKKYFSLIQLILNEINNIYNKDMQNCIMEAILLMPNKNIDHFSTRNCMNYNILNEKNGFTYNIFIIRRELLKEKYFLSLEPIKFIINTAQSKLPTVICNFDHYCSYGLISLTDFQQMIISDIRKSLMLINQYYNEVSKAVAKIATDKKKLPSIMQCITHVFVQQIINIMIGSINHLLNILSDEHHCPQIKFQLILQNNQLLVSPSIEEIYSLYHSIIGNISTIAQDLVPLEEWLNIKPQSRYIKIKLPDWYIKESHDKLDVTLCNLFQSMNEHVAHISEEFYPICVPTIKDQILLLTSGEINFDLYLKYIEKYKIYLVKAKGIVANTYHTVGKLEQYEARNALKKESYNIVDIFLNKLIDYHQEFNLSICSEFENLKTKALNVPKNAQSLIELSEYVSYAFKVLMEDLECKIQKSIHMLSALLEITLLSEDHIELNRKTINWLHGIEPVFKQHHVLCEAMKTELEEDMQSRINDLNSEVDNIVPQLSVLDNMDDINRIGEYIEYYKGLLKQVKQIMGEMQRINEEERLFKFPETEYPKILELHEIIVPFYDLIYLIHQWQRDNAIWLDGPFEWLDAVIIEQKTLNYFEKITEMNKTFKARIKMDVSVNKCFKFSGIADDPDPMQQPAPLKLCWQALNDINDFKKYLPLVKCVCNPALRKRHWIEMSEICNFDLTPNAGTSLRKIIQFNLMDDIEKYEAISTGANKELNLQQKLLKMIQEWDDISFEIKYNEKSGINEFSNLNTIELLLENHLVIIEDMKTSNFVKPIISTVTDFYTSLIRIQKIIDKWNYIQILIPNLDTIFYHPNIKIQLIEESSLYKEIKEVLKNIENRLSKNSTFREIDNPLILNFVCNITEKLEKVHEGVKNYLETKRLCLPRFFFLSDEEIEGVLFRSYDRKKLHISIQKCFQGIKRIKMNKKNCIFAIVGDSGEEVHLEKFVSLHTPYDCEEKWLIHLENEVHAIIKDSILQCYQKFSKIFSYNNIENFPSMVIVCTFQLYWTSEIHSCFTPFNSEALKFLHLKYINHLNDLINELKSYSIQRCRNVLMSIITIVVNQRDIIKLLIDKNISNSADFEWITQLRYYLEENCIKVLMFNTTINYGYEYSYYKQSVVNTMLTDRCFHTLIQAYKYHLYGAITGPSTTGKTETMTSLAKAIAVNFHIFSCANILSYNFLSQTLKGLISCGAWLCFENFDELKLEFLSRITQNLICIFHAIATNLKIITLEGSSLNLNPTGHICIITKLSLFNYHDLPDNLKRLFRTVSMVAPDISKIIEIELFAAGMSNSKSLTLKLITFYKLLSEQLQCKSCNTFNLYSAKAVAKTIIYLKRCFPDENETLLLLRSLIDINLPQLCSVDILLFKNIIHNMFPDITLLPPNYSTFLETLEVICKSKSLHIHDVFKLKMLQMFELMYIHKGLILIGDPFVGKTEILYVLRDILLTLYEQGVKFGINVKLETIIPSVIDVKRTFGYFDENFKLWKDGICSKMFRSFSETDCSNKTWIIFDGPLNNVWIENLYSVLDTNKVLCLESGEKINVVDSVSIIFETMNLVHASPAILSRCGIIYIESDSVDWRANIKTHIARHNIYNRYEETLYQLFDWIMDPSLQFIYKHCTLILIVGKLHCVMSTLNLLEMYLRDIQTENTEEKDKMNHFLTWIQAAFIMSIIWGLGGNLNMNFHAKFNSFFVDLWNGTNKEYPKPEVLKNCDVTLPNEGLIQDNFYIFKGSGHWKHWGSIDLLKNEEILEMPCCNEIFVPTVDTIKYNYTILKHIKYKIPFILCGDISIGKTFLMKNLLQKKLLQGMYFNSFSFTSLDSVVRTQQLLLSKLNKISKNHYGPLKDQFCINFIDDLNVDMDQCRSKISNILELFRQYHSYGYFYDIKESEKIFIHDIMFSFALIENTHANICPRFLKHFNLYTMQVPSINTIFRIFSNIFFINLKKNSFTADVLSTVNSITNATIDIYNFVINTFRPIPTKFQYQFSIRDISRVINGCNLIQKESVETKITFVRLWAHEIWRVFGDRILDNNDKEWLFLKIREIAKCHFKDSFETIFDYLPKSKNNEITQDSFNYLMFNNFMDNDKRYEEISSIEKLKNKVLFYLNEYNKNVTNKIDVVISQYILECLIKISRILIIPGGNLLMISNVGSGRRSLMRLAVYIQHQELFEPSIHSYYDFHVWRTELKTILQKCGGLRKPFILFIKVKQVTTNIFSDISSLLATGEIPDLFSTNEKYDIIEMVRLHAQGGNKNAEISNHSVMNYFLDQCRNYLHIVICFNSTHKAIRSHLYTYPELLKYCTINWYNIWPTDTLTQISIKYISSINIEENLKTNIITAYIKLHNNVQEMSSKYYEESGKRIYITSSSFLHMLKLYVNLISKKQEHIVTMRNRYLVGLEKLELAAQQVEKMKATLTILKPQLELSAQKTINTMREVENENISVERATALVQHEEEIAHRKAEIAGRLKMECEADLAIAIPILEDAIAALNTLKPTDITLVKAMKNPPDAIKLVMAAVCVMLGVPPEKAIDSVTGKKYTDYWGPSKRVLSDMNFLQMLKDYDKDNISPNIMQVIKKTYMVDNNFKPHIVAKASSAAEGLCKWVRAMVSYNEVAKAVAPKKEKLFTAQKECNEVETFLNEKRVILLALNKKLTALNNSLQETLQQKVKLEKEVEDCTNKLYKAENLMTSLGGEKNRWMQMADNLKESYNNLVGDMIITCGIISYMASCNIMFRDQILEYWKQYLEDLKISYTKNYNLVNVLGEENEINHWYLCGLPKNRFSLENAIIMSNSELWCLFIDSQNQANQWIKTIENKNNLKIIKLNDSDYISTLQHNIENGIPTLIENVGEELEISLYPFLSKRTYSNGESLYLDIGYSTIKYSTDFRLYITTRLLNPQFSCEIFNKLTVIDFSISSEGLQDRLLDFIMSKETPELQDKFETLLMEELDNKKILKQQEDHILITLSSTTTNILDDENAIKSLDFSKNLSLNIIKKQEVAKTISLKIKKSRCAYVQLVKYCANLFDTLNDLSHLNHMYRFSFSWFMQLYRRSIETSNRSIILEKRLKFLKSSFTKNLHISICKSLLEKHKIVYSFLLCCKILLDDQQTTEEEIKYFTSSNFNHINPDYVINWLPSDIWINICNLSKTLFAFHGLVNSFYDNDKAWKQYYSSEPLQNHLLPEPWITKLSLFQKLILIKILRPDKIIIEIMQLIENILGNTKGYSPQIKISQAYTESSCLIPLLFILPACSAPQSLISAYAKKKGCFSKFISLSMSREQEEKAEVLIQKAQKKGGWVLLENCHLVPHWMIQLEKIYANWSISNVSLDFRLWLSSYSTKEFPVHVLQDSIKIAYDSPLSMKETLLNIYHSEPIANKEFFESCPGKDIAFSKLLFSLCLFHVVIKERKSFKTQGWNIPYNFDNTDLELSIMQLQNLINNTDYVPFNILLYFIGECNYGGKVENDFDKRCLQHLLNDYCNSSIIKNHQYAYENEIEKLIPQRCEYEYIIKHIEKIPLDLLPEVFGSNRNGLVIQHTTMVKEFFSSISSMNLLDSSSNEQSSENQILTLISNINDKLSNLTEINEIQIHTSLLDEPLERVLFCEMKLLKYSLETITKTLNSLKLALSGYLPFSDSLKELAEELYKNKIPHSWINIENNLITGNLAYYIDNLLKHAIFIKKWMNEGCPHNICFDAVFHCKMFLSAVSLTFSKSYDIPIEEIEFDFQVQIKGTNTEDPDVYFIHGLHLCGARWDFETNKLIESFTNELWQNMSPIRFKCSRNKKDIAEVYECPLYRTVIQNADKNLELTSKNFIICIPLKTTVHHAHWIKCGTALFCHIP